MGPWLVLLAAAVAASGRPAPVASSLSAIERGLTSTKYQHRARIDAAKGIYDWDCSIMAAWILRRAAPRAHRALATDKPLARDFFRVIAAADATRPRGGWLRLTSPSQIEAGDVFAWLKPDLFKDRPNTGHVGFVLGKPWPHPRFPSVWLMRVADATRELHGDDSRPPGGDGGFGTATMAFAFDDSGAPLAYGWYGQDQDPATFVATRIVFGRAF